MGPDAEIVPGLSVRVTKGGIGVMRLQYSCDPHKRPGTGAGDEWLSESAMGYPGGIEGARWRKEMEIDYGAMGGTKIFPNWDKWSRSDLFVVPPPEPAGYRLYGSYDHGWRLPSAYHVHGINTDGEILTFWEFYGDHVPVTQIAKIIKGEMIVTEDGREFPGNPYAGLETEILADPSIWHDDQVMKDEPNKSMAFLFEQEGVYMSKGDRGADMTVAEWLIGYFWADAENPLYRVTHACPKLIWELGKLRHKDISAKVALNKDQPEAIVDKDNHAWDGLKMFLKRFPPPERRPRLSKAPGSFRWWKKQIARAQNGEGVMSYRREMV